MMKVRKKTKEYEVEIDKNKVKILMSKFEIQQNDKIKDELNKIEILVEKTRKLWLK